MRLIDADSLKQKLVDHEEFFIQAYGGWENLPENDKIRVDELIGCIGEIVNSPTVDAEPVRHGRWETHGDDDDLSCCYFCSQCGYNMDESEYLDNFSHLKYCPHCGAKMDGETV